MWLITGKETVISKIYRSAISCESIVDLLSEAILLIVEANPPYHDEEGVSDCFSFLKAARLFLDHPKDSFDLMS